MLSAMVLWIGLGAVGAGDYLRPFAEKAFEQAVLDAEGFGDKKALAREADGLRVTLKPGEAEAGWKTPPQLRIGGDCTISATLVIRKLPKPAREDGAAIGIAVATQNIDQPDATLLRELEPDGKDVYRPIEKAAAGPQMMNPRMMNRRMFNPFGNPAPAPAKPERHTFPAGAGDPPGIPPPGPEPPLPGPRRGGQRATRDRQGRPRPGRHRGGEALRREPQRGRARGRPLPRPGDPRRPHHRPGHDRPHHPRDGRPRRAHGTRGRGPWLSSMLLPVAGPPRPLPDCPVNPPAAALVDLPDQVFAPPTTEPVRLASGGVVADLPDQVFASAPGPQANPGPKIKARIPLDEAGDDRLRAVVNPRGQVSSASPTSTRPGPAVPRARTPRTRRREPATTCRPRLRARFPSSKMPKVEPKPNGIRDIHLAVSGLRDAAIRQLMIQCPTDKGQAMWQLDTTGTPAWPVSLRRAGKETWADLFLEPPEGDCHNKQFMINLMYDDGQNANVQVQATGHTNPKLAFDPAAPTPALDARVYLAGDEQLFGKLEAMSAESLTLATTWGDRIDVPLARVTGVYMGMADHKETPESFAKRLKAPGSEDLLLARAKDGEVVAIGGVVEAAKDNKLTFAYKGKSRTIALKQVEGLVLAARPAPKPPTEVRPTFTLSGGLVLSGRWVKIEGDKWQVETPWGQTVKLPAAEIRGVRFRGGQMAYLSDLEPSKVEETPYFGRRSPYRRDVALDGSPLKLDDQPIEKGISVHSRTALTYDLDRRYATFEALVGFDASGGKKGRVDCRVFADGKELYANPDLRADAPPVRLSLPVSGAEQLRLVVDFGPDEDTGDRVIWANARLYRRAPAAAGATATVAAAPPDRSSRTPSTSSP